MAECVSHVVSDHDSQSSTESDTGTENKAVPSKRTHKRVRHVEKWKKNIRKMRRDTGQEYTSTSKKDVSIGSVAFVVFSWKATASLRPLQLVCVSGQGLSAVVMRGGEGL